MTQYASQTTADGAVHLTIDTPMTIYTAQKIKEQLMAGLQAASVLVLDLSLVDEMDTAGFQLLVMAKRECQRLGRTLRIVAHNRVVRDVIDFYNMDSFFGDPMVIPAGN